MTEVILLMFLYPLLDATLPVVDDDEESPN
jgi:hypothetical protein